MKIGDKIKISLYSFVPRFISNRVILVFFELLSFIQRIFRYKGKTEHNVEKYKKYKSQIEESSGYIENQNDYYDMSYGKTTIAYAGCEIIAVFNALNSLGVKSIQFPLLIADFERNGMVLGGKFGTSPMAIYKFLKKNNFGTEITWKEKEFDLLSQKSDSMILTLYNDKNNILKEIHTVNISKNKGYWVHNYFGNGEMLGPYKCIKDIFENINSGKTKGICLIGIKLTEKVN